MAMLNDDGTLDEAFVPRVFENGLPRFAKQLSDGLIVVSGTFVKYDGKTRNSFMVLNPDGSLAGGYNAVGTFSGDLYNVFETESADKKRALLLIGSFWQFDSKDAANIIRVLIE
jgi:predicted amidohydrolase